MVVSTIVVVNDRAGVPIDELTGATVPKRTWMLEDIGDAEVRIPRTALKATPENLDAYNILVIKSDYGVEDWGGVIVDRNWTQTEVVLELEDLRFLFDRRIFWGADKIPGGLTSGQAIRRVVRNVLRAEYNLPLVCAEGFLTEGLIHDHWKDDGWRDALDFTNEATRFEGTYWWVDANRMVQHAAERGTVKVEVVLEEGQNIVGTVSYKEKHRDIINDTIAAESESDTDVTAPVHNQRSIDRWGRFSDVIYGSVGGPTDTSATKTGLLRIAARSHIDQYKDPYYVFDFSVTNKDNLYENIRLGDQVRIQVPSYGFSGVYAQARILGMTLSEPSEEMRLILEVTEIYSQ